MHCWHDEWRVLGRLRGSSPRPIGRPTCRRLELLKLWSIFYNSTELFDEFGGEITVLIPKIDDALDLLSVLRRIRKGGGGLDKIRKEWFYLGGETRVAASDMNMVKHIVEKIQYVQPLALGRSLTSASAHSERGREGFGQGCQVLSQGGDTCGRVNQMLQYPLLAFLCGELFSCRTRLQLA